MIDYSIIIPHYNIPDMLERLLLTIPFKRENVEVIVVDDRSDDEVESLLSIKQRYEKEGVRFYKNNHGNKGAGTCRNIGLKHATGKWLIFADADDYFTKDFYEIVSAYVNSGADIVYFTPTSIDNKTGMESDRHILQNKINKDYIEKHDAQSELMLRQGVITPCSKLIKRELVKEYGICFDEVIVSNDVTFSTLTGFYAGSVDASMQVIYVISSRSGSLTKSYSDEIIKIRNDVFIKRCRFLKKNLSAQAWKMLDLNGQQRLIAMTEEGYPVMKVLSTAVSYMANGIRPVKFSKTSLNTTMTLLLSERKKRNGRVEQYEK